MIALRTHSEARGYSANGTELDGKEAKELLWALAVLWKDPPAGNPA
jgi:hypothetical protein